MGIAVMTISNIRLYPNRHLNQIGKYRAIMTILNIIIIIFFFARDLNDITSGNQMSYFDIKKLKTPPPPLKSQKVCLNDNVT